MATIDDNSLTHAGASARSVFSITPSDTVNFTRATRAIKLGASGAAGTVSCVFVDGGEETFNIAADEQIDFALKRINATGTSATGIKGLC